jgi:hypothetical protein
MTAAQASAAIHIAIVFVFAMPLFVSVISKSSSISVDFIPTNAIYEVCAREELTNPIRKVDKSNKKS